MKWHFVKYSGAGNDFILFDNRENQFPLSSFIVKQLCHRQEGIGADGVIFLEESSTADYKMRIFNADGSEAEMCGNGVRCLVDYIYFLGFGSDFIRIEIHHRVLIAKKNEKTITVEMGAPQNLRWTLPVQLEEKEFESHFLNTGVPHIVLFVPNPDQFDLHRWGPYLRRHSMFGPEGTNVNIAERTETQQLFIRTYERGVEAETLACGSGATACALAAAYQFNIPSPISVEVKSGSKLQIHFRREGDQFSEVTMSGEVRQIFQGSCEI